MKPASYRDNSMKGRWLFILTLWMAICVALLSALAPLGPPSSRLTGSAFNPATTSVALKARSSVTPQQASVLDPGPQGDAPTWPTALLGLLPLALLLVEVWLRRPGSPLWCDPGAFVPLLRHIGRRARAPPSLF